MKLNLADLREHIKTMCAARAPHILGCEQTAAELCTLWGGDEKKARTAALLHDITKSCSQSEQLKLAEKYGIIVCDDFYKFPALTHAVTGAEAARQEYGVGADIADAIRFHTTGRAGMTLLEKIIYLADYIEPTRDFKGLESLRELSRTNLDDAVQRAAGECISYNIQKSRPIHPATVEAFNYMVFRSLNGQNSVKGSFNG